MCVARLDVEHPTTPLQPREVSDSLISNVHVHERPVSPSSRHGARRERNFQAKNVDSTEVPF